MSTPPTIRPIAAPPPASAPKTPNAWARSFGSVNVTVTMDSEAGAIRAAKRALQGAGGEQQLLVGRETTDRGRTGEAEQADDEGALAAGVVGDPATQQQQRAEGQGVRRDHPLPVGVADVEVRLGRRERDVHDRGVEDDHQLRGREDGQAPTIGPGRARSGRGCWSSVVRVRSR